jgi:hypothetical protein
MAEFDPEDATPTSSNVRPGTPVLLWLIVFGLVVMMVMWSVRTFGTRSSAEPGAAPAAGGKP